VELRERLSAAKTPDERSTCWKKRSWRICSGRWASLRRDSRSILSVEPALAWLFAMSRGMRASANDASFSYSRARSVCRPSCFLVFGVLASARKSATHRCARFGAIRLDRGQRHRPAHVFGNCRRLIIFRSDRGAQVSGAVGTQLLSAFLGRVERNAKNVVMTLHPAVVRDCIAVYTRRESKTAEPFRARLFVNCCFGCRLAPKSFGVSTETVSIIHAAHSARSHWRSFFLFRNLRDQCFGG
jgi:hypothetical protein